MAENKSTTGILVTRTSIHEVSIGDYKHMQSLIGCRCFTAAGRLPNGDIAWVDDEGLYNPQWFTDADWYPELLAGNILIMGTEDSSGDSTDCESTVEEIEQMVYRFDAQ